MHAQESTETMTCTMLPRKRQVEARFLSFVFELDTRTM